MEKISYCFEQIIASSAGTRAYSLPNIIKDPEKIKELIRTIETDSSLKLMAFGDITQQKYSSATAKDMWDILEQYPIGQELKQSYPGIEKYRISGALTRGAFFKKDAGEKETPFEKFDHWANQEPRESDTTMPSFKDYINNPETHNPHQIMGASPRVKPLS